MLQTPSRSGGRDFSESVGVCRHVVADVAEACCRFDVV